MSDTTPQPISNGCRKYVKSKIKFNTFNTFNNVAYTNKESFEATESLTNEIIEKVKTFISRRKALTQYSYHKFFEEVNVSHTTWDNMRYNKNRSLTLDTAIRLLDKCGYELSIVPKEDKKKKPISYDHPDIIPPRGYYETSTK